MGTSKHPPPDLAATALASALFTPVQQRVLGLLFGQPERRFQSVEIIRLAGSGTGAAHRLLVRLAACGLVRATIDGRQKYYQANEQCPVFDELVSLMRKTVGLVAPLREALAPLASKIELAFVHGSIASGNDRAASDIDLIVVAGDLDYPTLYQAVQRAERQLGRTINPSLLTPREWQRKRNQPDGFAARVPVLPWPMLVGGRYRRHGGSAGNRGGAHGTIEDRDQRTSAGVRKARGLATQQTARRRGR